MGGDLSAPGQEASHLIKHECKRVLGAWSSVWTPSEVLDQPQ